METTFLVNEFFESDRIDTKLGIIGRLSAFGDQPEAQDALLKIAEDENTKPLYRCEAALSLNDKAKQREIINANIHNAFSYAILGSISEHTIHCGKWINLAGSPELYMDRIQVIVNTETLYPLLDELESRETLIMILTKIRDIFDLNEIGNRYGLCPGEWYTIARLSEETRHIETAVKHLGLSNENELRELAEGGCVPARLRLLELDPKKYEDYICDADYQTKLDFVTSDKLSQKALKKLSVAECYKHGTLFETCLDRLTDEALLAELLLGKPKAEGLMDFRCGHGFEKYGRRLIDKLKTREDILTEFILQNEFEAEGQYALRYIHSQDDLYKIACLPNNDDYGLSYLGVCNLTAATRLESKLLPRLLKEAKSHRVREYAQKRIALEQEIADSKTPPLELLRQTVKSEGTRLLVIIAAKALQTEDELKQGLKLIIETRFEYYGCPVTEYLLERIDDTEFLTELFLSGTGDFKENHSALERLQSETIGTEYETQIIEELKKRFNGTVDSSLEAVYAIYYYYRNTEKKLKGTDEVVWKYGGAEYIEYLAEALKTLPKGKTASTISDILQKVYLSTTAAKH